MSERLTIIVNQSIVAVVEKPYETGGHGDGPYKQRPITFVGTQNPSLDSVSLGAAPKEIKEEIRDLYLTLFSKEIIDTD